MTDQLAAQDDPRRVDALLDIVPEPGVRIDAAWTVTYLNGAAQQLWGRVLTVGSDLRAHPLLQHLTTVTGSPVTLAASPLARTLQEGVTQQDLEFVLWVPGQEPRQIRLSSAPVWRAGTVQGAILIVQPLTTYANLRAGAAEHNRALQALNDLATQLQRINTVETVCEAALNGMLPIIEATRGFVMLTDDAQQVFHMHAARNISAETVQLADNISYDVPSANNTSRQTHDITIVHPEQAAPVSQTILSVEGVQTAVTVPLLHDERVIGILSYLVEAYRDLTGDERAVLRTGATYIAAALERATLYEQAEAERERLARILEHLPVGVAFLDSDMRLINFNSAWATMVGTGAAERQGQPIQQFSPLAETHPQFYQQALEGAAVSADNVAYPRPDGTTRYYNIRYQPVRNPAGLIMGVISTTVDVTDAVQAHQALELQQARTAAIIADTPIGLSFFDRDMRVLTLNAEYTRIAHFDPVTAVGEVLYDLAPGTEARRALHDRVLAGEPLDEDNVPYQYPGEDTRFYDIRYRPVREAGGAITGILSAVTDVTDKVLAQQELEAQSGLMETMVAATPIGIAFFDRAMRAISLNVEWARMTGMDFATARGQYLYEALPTMREQEAAHQRALGGEAVDLDDVVYPLPGYEHPRHYDVHFRPIWDKDGAIAGILSAVSDVTARHEIDQQKDEFIALASHELKTPVTSIKGYAQSGLRTATKSGDERLMRTLRVIDEQSNRLTRLINELLDVSRTQNNTLSLYAEPFDLRRLVHEVVTNLQLTAPDFTLDLNLPTQPTLINADAQRIEQVVVNLVQNAIKYSGESQQVEVSVAVEGHEVITTVRDLGVGIPLDQQLRVFNRFFRASNVSSRHYSGLGLGLFIAHGIVERHGGRMWLQSVEGVGSTFSFALPLLLDTTK